MSADRDILPVDVAWRATGNRTTPGGEPPEDFEGLYVAATIAMVVDIVGHIADLVDTYTAEAAAAIPLPWGEQGSIVSVRAEGSDVELEWARDGDRLLLADPAPGVWVTIRCRAVVPANVALAARQICRQLWLADGGGGGGGGARPSSGGGEQVPAGFAIPKRAEALLAPWWRAGFA